MREILNKYMVVKYILYEDFVNYKKPSMTISFPYCNFKCEKDCGIKCCQNSEMTKLSNIPVNINDIILRYLNNSISKSVVMAGLEPFDSFDEIISFCINFRKYSDDDIVIYTGYKESEIEEKISELKEIKNIIVKFGRYIPNQKSKYDEVLGIKLASENQYGKRIS